MDARALLARLVAFDTVSSNSNLHLIDWIADYLDGHGCTIRLTHDDAGTKANLLARLGPEAAGGILLSGHSDVVPVEGQIWASDPFALTERDDRLYGRGVADMKGFIACCLAAVPNWPVSKLCRPIFIALSYDEEIGCLGAPRLISDLRAHLPKPALAVIGEPTGMRAVTAHKGVFVFRTEFRGRAVHSSDPEAGLSAVQYAVRFMQLLFDVAVELREVTTAVHGLDPPFTTLNVGLVSGGTALNIVPPVATITWEFRPIPEADIAGIRGRIDFAIGQLRSEMQRRCPEADIRIQQLARVLPLRAVADNAAVSAVRRLGVADAPTPAVPFGTEAGLFQAAEIPAVVCGPGSIAQAHRPDEWLAIDQLGEAASFVANLGNAAKTAE